MGFEAATGAGLGEFSIKSRVLTREVGTGLGLAAGTSGAGTGAGSMAVMDTGTGAGPQLVRLHLDGHVPLRVQNQTVIVAH